MERNLCISDIHGCYSKLIDVLDKCKFSDSDTLYCVGDLCDRGSENLKTLNFLMTLKNFHNVIGNHDIWLFEYLNGNMKESSFNCWTYFNGGLKTSIELSKISIEEKLKIYNWLKNIPYIIDLKDKIIIHTPTPKKIFNRLKPEYKLKDITLSNIKDCGLLQDEVYDDKVWNREVIACSKYVNNAQRHKPFFDKQFNKNTPTIFAGHTPLFKPVYDEQMNICLIDTGSFATAKKEGKDGHITIVDIDTFDYWQNATKQKKNLLKE